MYLRFEDDPKNVGATGVLSVDGPRVEVGRVSHLARPRVRCVLVAGVFEHGAVLLDGRLEEEKHSAVRLLERPLIRRYVGTPCELEGFVM